MRYFNSACNLFTDIISFMFKVILGCRYQFSPLYKRTMKFEEASSEKKNAKRIDPGTHKNSLAKPCSGALI